MENVLPPIGFGTGELHGEQAEQAVTTALERGYRLIDTAAVYGNEVEVGNAIRGSGIARAEIIVMTKGAHDADEHGYDQTLRAFQQSLNKLGLSYVDYYLIHWPSNASLRRDTWRALEYILEQGGTRAIGVSNYAVHHLKELHDMQVLPAVNQIEFHPFIFSEASALLQYNQQNNIITIGYSTFAQGQGENNEAIVSLCHRLGKQPQQILARWAIQHGVVPLIRSGNPTHILQNLQARNVSLSNEDMAVLDTIHGHRIFDNPTRLP